HRLAGRSGPAGGGRGRQLPAVMADGASALRALAPDLWVADRPLKLFVGDIGARMTVVRLHDGSLFLHSPVQLDEETRSALDTLGPVRAVVAPSKVHHLFVGDYVSGYPDAAVYGAPGLAAKRAPLRSDRVRDDGAPGEWGDELEQHFFRGAPSLNEVVFLPRPTRPLALPDPPFTAPAGGTSG